MAKLNFKDGGTEYQLHPVGTYEGFIKEVRLAETKEYPNDDGSITFAEPRHWFIENLDGYATYTYNDKDGVEQTGAMSVRTAPLNLYFLADNTFRTPTAKSRVFEYYQTALGEPPDFSDFDDECVLGVKLMYQVVHNDATNSQGEAVTYANIQSIMLAPDQSSRSNNEVITQAQREEMNASRDNGTTTAATETVAGSIGEQEELRAGCTRWLEYLQEKGVYTPVLSAAYGEVVKTGKIADLNEFAAKAEADCTGAKIQIPRPHPMSSGADNIPF